ncbi:MAG: hypothetical protein GYA36_18370 [Veillonellaceae bacterium]|nr:hypothetical protein [Veillonellaceae bacterium]
MAIDRIDAARKELFKLNTFIDRDVFESLDKLEKYIRDKEKELEENIYQKKHLKNSKEEEINRTARYYALDNVSDAATQIIKEEAMSAFSKKESLNLEPYRSNLISLIDSYGFFNFIDRYKFLSIYEKDITRINLDFTILGNNDDLAQMIQITRNTVSYGDTEDNKIEKGYGDALFGDIASKVWWSKLYLVGRKGMTWTRTYKPRKSRKNEFDEKTVEFPRTTAKLRKMYNDIVKSQAYSLANKAPYWILLNYSNDIDDLSTNKGGPPMPKEGPTNFVQKAEMRINDLIKSEFKEDRFNELLKMAEKSYNDSLDRYTRSISNLKKVIKLLKDLLEELENKPKDYSETESYLYNLTNINNKVMLLLTESIMQEESLVRLIKEKSKLLALQISAHEYVGDKFYFTTIEGRQIRIRTKELLKSYEQEEGNFLESDLKYIKKDLEKNLKYLREQIRLIQETRRKERYGRT